MLPTQSASVPRALHAESSVGESDILVNHSTAVVAPTARAGWVSAAQETELRSPARLGVEPAALGQVAARIRQARLQETRSGTQSISVLRRTCDGSTGSTNTIGCVSPLID